jgi:putative iron-dependent peroxidase
MPSPLREMCCFTSVPGEWTYASSWQHKSWNVSAKQLRLPTRFRAFATLTIATSSASSTALRIQEAQERIIGRKKLSDIELDDAVKPTSAHSALTVIVEDGKEVKILRDNMPFGQPSRGEFGTYFIGYSRTPRVTEQMLENMFVGRPPGNYDRLLDFSRAVTGGLFFAPSATFLEGASGEQPAAAAIATPPAASDQPAASTVRDTSLGIGSLRGARHE